jgi:hypothetical protein
MDKQGVGVDMWTSLQNAQLDHIPTPPTLLTHKGPAYGLTRFACQHPFEINTMNSQYQVKNPAAKAAMRNTQNTICAAQLLLAAQPVTINRNDWSRSPEYATAMRSNGRWRRACAG